MWCFFSFTSLGGATAWRNAELLEQAMLLFNVEFSVAGL